MNKITTFALVIGFFPMSIAAHTLQNPHTHEDMQSFLLILAMVALGSLTYQLARKLIPKMVNK